jgi:pimeloyl-ACP methyl ester carboxylesterase
VPVSSGAGGILSNRRIRPPGRRIFGGEETNPVERFLTELHDFKSEIEERIATYFDFHALRCLTPAGHGLDLVDADDGASGTTKAWGMLDSADRGFLAEDSAQRRFAEFCEQAGEAFGISLLAVDRSELLNPVDRLFQERIERIAAAVVSSGPTDSAHLARLDRDARVDAMTRMRQRLDSLRAERNRRRASLLAGLKPRTIEQCPGLAYLAAGEGDTPVVLINALGQGLACWARLFDALSRNQRVVIWEPRGVHSGSDFTIEDHVSDLERILDREAASRCRLVAWCTGPKVALELCRRRPTAVESMVFLNPSLKGPGLSNELDTAYERTLQQLCALVSRRPDMAAFVRDALRDSIGRRAEADEANFPVAAVAAMNADLLECVLDPFRTEASTVSYCRQLLDFWSHDAAASAAGTAIPVLLVAAEFDDVASPAMAKAARDLTRATDYAEIRGATHYCLYDRPEMVADLIEGFFRRAVARAEGSRELVLAREE